MDMEDCAEKVEKNLQNRLSPWQVRAPDVKRWTWYNMKHNDERIDILAKSIIAEKGGIDSLENCTEACQIRRTRCSHQLKVYLSRLVEVRPERSVWTV